MLFLKIYSLVILVIGLYSIITTLLNIRYFRRIADVEIKTTGEDIPLVSIIIPARNEEEALPRLLNSLLKQKYKNIEILVINDQSTDKTQEIIDYYSRIDSRVKGFKTDPDKRLTAHGKMNALLQLIPHAKGEYLLATDADTQHATLSIAHTVAMMQKHDLDIMSGFPTQLCASYRGSVNISAMMFSNTMIPHFLLYRLQIPALAFAIGQYIIMRRDAYEDVGGYLAVKNKIVDDIGIIRLFVSKKKKYAFVNLSEEVACYMYKTGAEAFYGISRSIAGVFPSSYLVIPLLILAVIALMLIAWAPLSLLIYVLLGYLNRYALFMLVGWILFCTCWYMGCRNINFRKLVSISGPISITMICAMYIYGFYRRISGKKFIWKGRVVG